MLLHITHSKKKIVVLLDALSKEAYGLVYSMCVSDLPESKTYKQLIELFNSHIKSTESVFQVRAKFHSATQKPRGNISS